MSMLSHSLSPWKYRLLPMSGDLYVMCFLALALIPFNASVTNAILWHNKQDQRICHSYKDVSYFAIFRQQYVVRFYVDTTVVRSLVPVLGTFLCLNVSYHMCLILWYRYDRLTYYVGLHGRDRRPGASRLLQ